VSGINEQVIGKRQQAFGDRAVKRPCHLLRVLLAVRMQVGPPRRTDQQRVTRQDHPGLLPSPVIGDQERVVGGGVSGRRDGLNHGVAELHQLAVRQRMVLETDSGALGHVCGGAGALDQLGQSGDVIGLDVGLEHRGDPRALRLRAGDVPIDQVDVRVHHGELARGLATEQVRRASRLVVQELAEEHLRAP
jgi:hypothetical protein